MKTCGSRLAAWIGQLWGAGAALGKPCQVLDSFWAALGNSWELWAGMDAGPGQLLASSWAALGALGQLWERWGGLGQLLEGSGRAPGQGRSAGAALGKPLGGPWAVPVRSLGGPWASLGRPWGSLDGPWASLGGLRAR